MKIALGAAAGLYFLGSTCAFAVGQATALNLGFTSFLDGFGDPTGSGLVYENYVHFTRSDALTDDNGDNLGLPGTEINAFVDLNQFVYNFDTRIFGFQPAIDVLVPIVSLSASYSEPGPFPQASGTGIGDVIFGPIFQGAPITRGGRPVFVQRFEFDFFAPTGKFDRDKTINPGSGFWSFNPYWAATVSPLPKLTISTRLHYLYNWTNHAPARPIAGDGSFQAGQAFFGNFTAAYEIKPEVRVGLNGYFFQQFTDNEIDGEKQANSREKALALGPGALFEFGKQNFLFANVYFEISTQNRPKGDTVNLRWVHFFNVF